MLTEIYNTGDPGTRLPMNFDTDDALGELPMWIFGNHAEIDKYAEKISFCDPRGQLGSILMLRACKIVERISKHDRRKELDEVMGRKIDVA